MEEGLLPTTFALKLFSVAKNSLCSLDPVYFSQVKSKPVDGAENIHNTFILNGSKVLTSNTMKNYNS